MTPDTLPADILGTYVFDQRTGEFKLHKGPIFGNVILVDELNRATPKAQAALLESMQERQVSYEGETMTLDEPFMVVATQIPYGSAGTYALSEVQSDRFTFSVPMEYPTIDHEIEILSRIDSIEEGKCSEILSLGEILSDVESVRKVFVSDPVKKYIVSLCTYLRNSQNIKMPPSIRASIALHKGARSMAFLEGRDHVIPDDVKFLCPYVFSHRIFLTTDAIAEEVTVSQMVSEMTSEVPVPRE
jgi:MoxR-like ATPase